MNRKIIQYFPTLLQPFREIKAIADGQQWLFDLIWNMVDKAFQNQYIDTADEYGLSRWESILKIISKGTDTLEERRFRIKTRLNEQLPFTIRTLRQRLENLCGSNMVTITLEKSSYVLTIRVSLEAKNKYTDIENMIHRICPANILLDLNLDFNTHRTLSNFTYGQLGKFSYQALREEALKLEDHCIWVKNA